MKKMFDQKWLIGWMTGKRGYLGLKMTSIRWSGLNGIKLRFKSADFQALLINWSDIQI